MRLDEGLTRIGREILTISRDSTVDEAIRLMADRKTRALIVLEGREPAGIFTAADLVRTHVKCHGRPLTDVAIHEVMTNKLIVAEAGSDIGGAVGIMQQTGIGCLPMVKDGEIAAAFFLRDLLQYQIDSLRAELETLHDYLADLQNAVVD